MLLGLGLVVEYYGLPAMRRAGSACRKVLGAYIDLMEFRKAVDRRGHAFVLLQARVTFGMINSHHKEEITCLNRTRPDYR